MDALTEKVLNFKLTGNGWDELLAQIRILVYFFPRRCAHWSMEESSDFFFFFHERIPGIIEKFKYVGKDFNAYLSACLRFQMICFQKEGIHQRLGQEAISREAESLAEEQTEYYSPDGLGADPIPKLPQLARPQDPLSVRKVLMLCLKSCYFLDSGQLDAVCEATGVAHDRLHSMIQELRRDLEKVEPRVQHLRDKRMNYFLKAQVCQHRMAKEMDQDLKDKLAERWKFYKKKQEHLGRCMARLKIEPKHKDIARVLGVPKGTVDSCLSLVKKQLAHLLQKT